MSAPLPFIDEREPTEVEAALAYHDGNAEATIATLLEDLRFLRKQLALAEGAMSTGMTRGWRPSYERD
jgi:predicted aldo/keto reductase-like oxidoreductase